VRLHADIGSAGTLRDEAVELGFEAVNGSEDRGEKRVVLNRHRLFDGFGEPPIAFRTSSSPYQISSRSRRRPLFAGCEKSSRPQLRVSEGA
jgi:hypothetical protein